MDWGPFDMTGRNAIVTGAGRGIGFGIAARLLEAGANVLLADRGDSAERAVDTLSATRGKVIAASADVTDPDAGASLVQRCVDELGAVDVLVNNAGIYPLAPFVDVTAQLYDDIMAVNLRALFFVSQAVAQRMIAQGTGGTIVNMASQDGFRPTLPGLAPYGASKAGVLELTRNMALELAPHGIRVVSVAPGVIMTEGTRAGLEQGANALDARIPLGRVGTPDDIATVVTFLASPAASYVTGENVLVDGGIQLH
jgi:NAD(P)-dependent dehydrogenase (short-subunit alcohol dehydrogenase family)